MTNTANRTIYIVADDTDCRIRYQQYLIHLGFQSIAVFSTGQELLDHLHLKPALIFLDNDLPDYKGLELFGRIKEVDPHIYVIVITEASAMDNTVQLLNKGALDYITKGDHEDKKIAAVLGKWLAAMEYQEKINAIPEINPADNYLNMVLEAQEKVRKEISNELHDNINQLLGASKMYIETAIRDEENRLSLMQESKKIISAAIAEIRKLSHSLQTVYIKSVNLEEELKGIVANLQQQNSFHVQATIDIHHNQERLSAEMQHGIIRIIQEQVNNMVKYSQASNIYIHVAATDSCLEIELIDDGIGFDLTNTKRGLGLTNIFDRIKKLKGTYKIKTAPGKGCRWYIKIPLEEHFQQAINTAI